MTAPLLTHLEDHLGRIENGWAVEVPDSRLRLQVVLFQGSPLGFEGRPLVGVRAISTLGLSHTPLRVGDRGRRLRQELVAMFKESDGHGRLPAVLLDLALSALRRDVAYAPGDVVGPDEDLRISPVAAAFYTALPNYLPDSFQVCRATPEPVVLAWMVPVTDAEARYARTRGRDAFESVLESADPDVLDVSRQSIV